VASTGMEHAGISGFGADFRAAQAMAMQNANAVNIQMPPMVSIRAVIFSSVFLVFVSQLLPNIKPTHVSQPKPCHGLFFGENG